MEGAAVAADRRVALGKESIGLTPSSLDRLLFNHEKLPLVIVGQ